MNSEKHTLQQLQEIIRKVVAIRDTGKSDKVGDLLAELCKLLVWGDRFDSDFFQQFFEVKVLDRILEIFSKTASRDVVIAIITFFNNLIPNLSKSNNINFLLSHSCILSLQNIKFLTLDNQTAEYYINFLCILSQKIDNDTLHMFFNKRYPTFPLLMQTTRFYNHPESLVRTKCRSILLSCVKINNPRIRKFAGGFPFVAYYINECNLLKQYWQIIDNIVELEGDKQFQLQNLEGIFEDQKELIMILDDFMKIDPEKIGDCFINAFANQCMSPLLQDLSSFKKVNFNIKVVLLILAILIGNIRNVKFLDFLVFSLFSKYYPTKLCVKLMHPIEKPLFYSKKWKFKGFWDNFASNINEYCVPVYFGNEKTIVSDLHNENSNMKDNVNERQYTKEMRSIFGMGTNFYDRETEKIQQIFSIPINSNPLNFQRKSVSQLLDQVKMQIKTDSLNLIDFEENPVRQPILSFLKSKDDTLVMLILNLLNSVITNNYISQYILDFVALSVSPKNYDFQSLFDIQKVMKCCYGIMAIDPPAFRICTYKQAASTIKKLSEIYQGKFEKIPEDLKASSKVALKQSVQRIQQYLYSGKNWDQILDIFNKVSQQNGKYKRKDLYTYGFLEKDATEINMLQYYQIYNIHPKYPEQLIARDFWLYMIARDSYCQLTGTQLKFPIVNCDEKAQKNASNFEVGTKYEIQADHEISASFQEPHEKGYSSCCLIFLGGYFVVGVDKIVKYKSSYQDCIMMMDKSDPNKNLFEINKKIISIQVENAKRAYQIRKHFNQMKTIMFKYQLSLLVKQTEWLLQQASQK